MLADSTSDQPKIFRCSLLALPESFVMVEMARSERQEFSGWRTELTTSILAGLDSLFRDCQCPLHFDAWLLNHTGGTALASCCVVMD